MKTKILLIGMLSLVMTLPMVAQTDTIPNSSFENWSAYNGIIEVPDNWHVETITSSVTDLNGTHIYDVVSSASQTTDNYTGNYAIALSNKLSFIDYFGNTSSLWGKMFTLPPDGSLQNLKSAFPVSARHTTLNGYYKFTPVNGDSCQFMVLLYKSGYVNPINSAYGNMVGYGSLCKSTSSSYSPFTVTINYFDSTTIPDSASIALSAFKQVDFTTMNSYSPLGNSVLYVDKLSFDDFAAGINTISNSVKELTTSPNPASSVVTIDMLLKEADYQVNLYDLKGNLVKDIANEKLAGQQQIAVNVEDIPSGTYLLVISTNDGYVSKKLIIQRK